MSWPFGDPPDSDGVKLGRTHEVNAEIHYSSGSDRWWYHGPLWVTEVRPIREREFNPILRDPRNRAVVEYLRGRPSATDEEVAAALSPRPAVAPTASQDGGLSDPPQRPSPRAAAAFPAWVVRDVRRALEHAEQVHQLRIYGLEKVPKEQERVLVTIDQDPIHEAPMIPYSRTEKGAKRMQIWVFLSMILADTIALYFMAQFLVAAPSVTTASAQLAGLGTQFLEAMLFPFALLAVYAVMARRTLVLDMEFQPVVEGLQDTHSEAVFLTNSEKTPVTTYVQRLFHLSGENVRRLSLEIGEFQADTISNLQEQTRSTRSELDTSKVLGIDRYSSRADLDTLSRGASGGPAGGNWAVLFLIVGIVAVVAVAATYAIMASGG